MMGEWNKINWNDYEKINDIIRNSINKTDVLNKLGLKNNGGNYRTLTRFIYDNEIDITHFKLKKATNGINTQYKNIFDVLIEKSPYKSSSNLKERLYKEGLKERTCEGEDCGIGEEWKGKKISLIIDHINGKNNDNRLENLRILCPNCNATLKTHCKGYSYFERNGTYDKVEENRKTKKCENNKCDNMIRPQNKLCLNCYKEKRKSNKNRCDNAKCNKELKNKKSQYCIKCFNEKKKKIERPPYEQLLQEVKELGYSGTGRKYGVSDNAIRKWVKKE